MFSRIRTQLTASAIISLVIALVITSGIFVIRDIQQTLIDLITKIEVSTRYAREVSLYTQASSRTINSYALGRTTSINDFYDYRQEFVDRIDQLQAHIDSGVIDLTAQPYIDELRSLSIDYDQVALRLFDAIDAQRLNPTAANIQQATNALDNVEVLSNQLDTVSSTLNDEIDTQLATVINNFVTYRRKMSLIAGFIFGGLLIILCIIQLRLIRTINRPIQELVATADIIKNGDLSVRASSNYTNEFGTIAEAFNSLADTLTSKIAEAQALQHEAEASNRAKSAFLANMSHELRTPLNAVIGYSEILSEIAEEDGFDYLKPKLQRIYEAGHHLLNLINDILDLSKIEAGRVDLEALEVDVDELILDVLKTMLPSAQQRHNRLIQHMPTLIGKMTTDPTRLRQILLNLLSNAIKFTEHGTICLETRIIHHTSDEIQITIQDSGIGMTTEQQERLFEPFMQADSSTTRRYGGTGLGLALSQRLARMLGGHISVQSTPDAGSSFTLHLPYSIAQVPQRTTSTLVQATNSDLPLLLVVDDDPVTFDLLQNMLPDWQIQAVQDVQSGLDFVQHQRPDVIVLDVLMPGQDGWALLRTLKQDPLLADIPVMVLTILPDKQKAMSLGAAEFLPKPIDRTHLMNTLERFRSHQASVLVVEDDPASRELLQTLLEPAGWSVHTAEDGEQALQYLGRHQPDVVLLDLMMPHVDGFQVIEAMRAHPHWRHIPILVLTAMDLAPSEVATLQQSVQALLYKADYQQHHLLKDLRELVGKPVSPF